MNHIMSSTQCPWDNPARRDRDRNRRIRCQSASLPTFSSPPFHVWSLSLSSMAPPLPGALCVLFPFFARCLLFQYQVSWDVDKVLIFYVFVFVFFLFQCDIAVWQGIGLCLFRSCCLMFNSWDGICLVCFGY